MAELHRAYLSLGSNIEAEVYLPKAIRLLRKAGEIKEISRVWESRAVGSDGPNFLNACVLFLADAQLNELKEKIIKPIEVELGRIRYADKNAPRTIDIDIVLFDETPLKLEFWNYAFIAMPLSELIPDFEHPVSREKLIRVAEQLKGQAWIAPRGDVVIS